MTHTLRDNVTQINGTQEPFGSTMRRKKSQTKCDAPNARSKTMMITPHDDDITVMMSTQRFYIWDGILFLFEAAKWLCAVGDIVVHYTTQSWSNYKSRIWGRIPRHHKWLPSALHGARFRGDICWEFSREVCAQLVFRTTDNVWHSWMW